jgi:hypothetical protein
MSGFSMNHCNAITSQVKSKVVIKMPLVNIIVVHILLHIRFLSQILLTLFM